MGSDSSVCNVYFIILLIGLLLWFIGCLSRKYIEFIDHDLEIDYEKEMARIQSEMKEIMMQEKKSQQMLEDAFRGIGYGID